MRSLLKGLGELDDDEDDDNKEVSFWTVSGPGACIRVKNVPPVLSPASVITTADDEAEEAREEQRGPQGAQGQGQAGPRGGVLRGPPSLV